MILRRYADETEDQFRWRIRERRSVVRQEIEETYRGGHRFEAWDEPCDGPWKPTKMEKPNVDKRKHRKTGRNPKGSR